MAVIKDIIIHHAGGLGNNNYASTKWIDVNHINRAHQARWPNFKSSLGYFVGYNAVYDPKTKEFIQTRKIGEETAAAIGKNKDSFHLCIIGNYNKGVDKLDKEDEANITVFLHKLINNMHDLKVEPGTLIQLDQKRIYPHRFFANKDCYGTGFSDTYFRDLVIAYKPIIVNYEVIALQERISALQKLIQLYILLLDLKRRSFTPSLAAWAEDREDSDNLPEDIINL